MASRYQDEIATEIHFQSQYAVVGFLAAISSRAGNSIETCGVPSEVALG